MRILILYKSYPSEVGYLAESDYNDDSKDILSEIMKDFSDMRIESEESSSEEELCCEWWYIL